jgi:peptide/nickel transport system permease protein
MANRARSSPWARAVRTPIGAAAATLLVLLVVAAVVAPLTMHSAANTVNVAAARQGPSASHWLGTDGLGRDVLARVLVATRLSLELAVLATLVGAGSGVLLGALPSVLGRRLGRLGAGLINLLYAFPGLLLALFLVVIFGAGAAGAVLALGLASAPGFARFTQPLAASVTGSDYVAAARVLGVRRWRMLVRHVLPNIAEPLLIITTISIGSTLLAFAGLSFLGFGVQPPSYDWGQMLNSGLTWIYVNPAAALAPGAAVIIAGVAFNLFGEASSAVAGVRVGRRLLLPAALIAGAAPETGPAAEGVAERAASGLALRVDGLTVGFPSPGGPVTPVADVSLELAPGELVGLVGESGSGKSLTAAGIAGLVPHPGTASARRIEVAGVEVQALSETNRKALLGTGLAMVFQDPMSALNPALRVGRQLAEVAEVHQGASRRAALARATDRLRAVRINAPERRARQYPQEFSGGMRQRAVIGMGLMGEPSVIIADEPTTGLDVTVQQQVLALLSQVCADRASAVLLISHDISVVAGLASRVLVMYGGRIIEELPSDALLDGAAHPYTRALVASVPDMTIDRDTPLATIPGRPPDPAAMPPGCSFAPRCPLADDRCRTERPPLEVVASGGRRAACWHPQAGPQAGQPARALTGREDER